MIAADCVSMCLLKKGLKNNKEMCYFLYILDQNSYHISMYASI